MWWWMVDGEGRDLIVRAGGERGRWRGADNGLLSGR